MIHPSTLEFIRLHAQDDVRQLAFLGSKHPEVDLPFALDQIRGRQMAKTKLPQWAKKEGVIYPPHISMEQCSSEQTALYKARLATRLLKEMPGIEDCVEETPLQPSLVDLTGGFGVDFSYMAEALGGRCAYVEQQKHLCEAARHNFPLLGLEQVEVVNGDGTEVLQRLQQSGIIFLDPARRDGAGKKVVSLHDCTPDVTLLQEELLQKARCVIIKLSPMLDWHKATADLKGVREVHIVSVGGECKELLLVLSAQQDEQEISIHCVNDAQEFVFTEGNEGRLCIANNYSKPYLYEPNASLMKAGCFAAISERYGLEMVAQNSHLFLGKEPIDEFPGRTFRIRSLCSLNKKELKQQLQGIEQANIAVRNFPLTVADLRKRLKLKDGGSTYLFATTLSDGRHALFITEKT